MSVPDDPKLESCIQKVMAQGHDKSSAIAICRASMNMTDNHAEKLGFEPFGTVDGVLRGEPIKIMPVGKFYRDERVIDITESDLQEIERNVAAGLPRFRIPINENHGTDGKVGTVNKVKYMPDGPDGKGLYAVDYSLTEVGQAAIKAKKWDAVSPEMIWNKNGATYLDPQTGKKFSGVLVGLALCDKPFFSHEHVALFTAEGEMPMDKHKRGNGYTKLREMMKAKFDELMAMVKDEDGDGEPDMDMPEKKKPEGMSAQPVAAGDTQPAADAAIKGVEHMAEDKTQPTPPASEQFAVTAEEFAALKAKADKADQLVAIVDSMGVNLRKVERARRLDQLTAHVDGFTAIGADKAELAAKLQELEEAAPALFTYFDGLLGQLDGALSAGLFGALATGKTPADERGADTFAAAIDKVWAEKYERAPEKYADAALEVAKAQPKLARDR